MVHFLRCLFSWLAVGDSSTDPAATSRSTFRNFLSLSEVTDAAAPEDIASKPISSRNGQPGVGENLGEDGNDTRLCFEDVTPPGRRGNGAVNEKVEEGALSLLLEAWGSSVAMFG
jgi:hypothetical protein